MLGEPGQWSRGASQSRGALLFCTDKFCGVNNRLLLILALCAVGASSGAGQQRRDAPPIPAALSDFFTPGLVFQDRNGDGAVDFVDARIVLPEQPSAAEVAAASDVAARLGYETSAMNLPLPVARGDERERRPATRRRQSMSAPGRSPDPERRSRRSAVPA